MKLEQLEQLIEIEKYGSVSKAAKSLYLSPATLSNNLSALESEIGVRLFERAPVGVTPTSEGVEVVQLARQVLDLCHQIVACGDREKELTGSVTVLIAPAYQYIYSELMLQFQQRFPNATLCLEECSRPNIMEKLLSGSFNVALLLAQESIQKQCELLIKKGMQIHYFPSISFETKVFVSNKHRFVLCEKEYVTTEDLTDECFIGYSEEYWSMNKDIIPANIKPLLIKDNETIRKFICENKGIGIFPESLFVSDWRYKQGLIRGFTIASNRTPSTGCLIYSKKGKLTFLEQEAISLIKEILPQNEL